MDADSMLWQRHRLGEAGAVAVRGEDGELDGLVLEDALWAIPGDQRPWVMLTQLMVPFDRLARADLDEELASVLPRLNPSQPVVTVWDQGQLLGVVPPKRLAERLAGCRDPEPEPSGVANSPVSLRHRWLIAPGEVDPLIGATPDVVALHDRL